ncbi:MAG: NAD(P)/FAD-dependent oxidoreductase [Alphaproteobacteria bacterium]|nr:NAD(P)/FAD-dependent oxidoreductase [Alphaproteobacteria bacterium]
MKRRTLLSGMSGILATGLAPGLWQRSFAADPEKKRRVVIAGGGFAGAKTAVDLKRLVPDAEILLIEPEERFFSSPSSLDVAFGRIPMASALRSYDLLARKGIRLIKGRVLGADPLKRSVETSQGSFAYSALVAASGIDLVPEAIEGLKGENALSNLSLYDRKRLPDLAKAIADFKGGTIVVSAPAGAIKCAPAPYEYTLLLAHHLKSRGLKGKVVLIDDRPNPQPQSVASGFSAAMEAMGPYIDYLFQETVARVDVKKREVETGMGDKIAYDLLTLIPPNRGSALVKTLGIAGQGDSFAEVDPTTMKCAAHEAVYAVGDAARTPYGISASSSTQGALLCAAAVADSFGVRQQSITAAAPARIQTACYPFTGPEQSMRTVSRFLVHMDKGEMKLHSDPDIEAKGTPANLAARRKWEDDLLASIFG